MLCIIFQSTTGWSEKKYLIRDIIHHHSLVSWNLRLVIGPGLVGLIPPSFLQKSFPQESLILIHTTFWRPCPTSSTDKPRHVQTPLWQNLAYIISTTITSWLQVLLPDRTKKATETRKKQVGITSRKKVNKNRFDHGQQTTKVIFFFFFWHILAKI